MTVLACFFAYITTWVMNIGRPLLSVVWCMAFILFVAGLIHWLKRIELTPKKEGKLKAK